MKKLIFILMLLFALPIFSSPGAMKGKILDANTKDPIPFANIVIENNGTQISAAITDFDGNYSISPIEAGSYDLKVMNVGYQTKVISGVIINPNETTYQNIELQQSVQMLDEVVVTSYKVPLISKDQTQSGGTVTSYEGRRYNSRKGATTNGGSYTKRKGNKDCTNSGGNVTSEEIAKMPGRDAGSIAATVNGVQSSGNNYMNIRGSRSGSTVMYVDGVRVRGSSDVPKSAVDHVNVLTGGVPAKYESENEGISHSIQVHDKRPRWKKRDVQQVVTNYFYNTEEYDEIIEREFSIVKSEPLSTFSLDVDVASYSNCRRFITNGQLPPANAVRIEEFINYFTYNYPEPEGEDPFFIWSEIADCPWNINHKLIHVGIQGEKIETEDLPPNNLVFLVDVSGSMGYENKLPLVQKSLKLLVNELGEKDRIAMVVYAGASGVVLNSTSCKDKKRIFDAIDDLSAGGSTAGSAGIKLAYEIAHKNFKANANNRVILCTDGDFNVGITSDDALVKLIESKRDDGIFLSVLGYGMGNYKDSKMEKLADKGNGNYAYIDNLMEAQKVLVKEMNATLHTIAKDVKIQVEFNPAYVKSYKLIGYENRMLAAEDFNDDKKDAGEVGAGKSVTALYEIELKEVDGPEIVEKPKIDELKYQEYKIKEDAYACQDIAMLKLRYKKPDGKQSILLVHPINNDFGDLSNVSTDFKFVAAVAEFGLILRDSKFKGDSNLKHAIMMAKQGQGIDNEGYRSEFIRLAELVKSISPKIAEK